MCLETCLCFLSLWNYERCVVFIQGINQCYLRDNTLFTAYSIVVTSERCIAMFTFLSLVKPVSCQCTAGSLLSQIFVLLILKAEQFL